MDRDETVRLSVVTRPGDGRVRETIEWDPELLSDVRRRAGPGESFVVSGSRCQQREGRRRRYLIPGPSVPPPPPHNHFHRHQTSGTSPHTAR